MKTPPAPIRYGDPQSNNLFPKDNNKMAKSTLDLALAELDICATTVLDIIAKAGARAPDHAKHADLSTIEIAVNDLRVALRNR